MTRDEMWHEACKRFESWACMYADKNVTDKQFFEELCCSVYAGEEFEKPVLNEDLCFKYKGYWFECIPCTALATKEQVLDAAEAFKCNTSKGIFTDRCVCWMRGHKDEEGKTKEQSNDPDNWTGCIYLVPDAWVWGATFYCIPGTPVDDLILKNIDKFLEQNPDL